MAIENAISHVMNKLNELYKNIELEFYKVLLKIVNNLIMNKMNELENNSK